MAENEPPCHSNVSAWPLTLSLSAAPAPLPSRKRKARLDSATAEADTHSPTHSQDGSERQRTWGKRTRLNIGPCSSPSTTCSTSVASPLMPPQQCGADSMTRDCKPTPSSSTAAYFVLSSQHGCYSAAAQSEVFHHRFLLWQIMDFLPLRTVMLLSRTCKYFLQSLNLVPGSLYSVHQLLQQFRPYLAHRSCVQLSGAMCERYMLQHPTKLIDFNDFVATFVGCRSLHVDLPAVTADNSEECSRMGRRLLLGIAQMTNNKLEHLTVHNLTLPDRHNNAATPCYGIAPRLCAGLESLTITNSSIASDHWHQLFALLPPSASSITDANSEQDAYPYVWPRLQRITLERCVQLLDTHLSWLTRAHCPALQHFAVPHSKQLSAKTILRVCQQYHNQLLTFNVRAVGIGSTMLQQCISHTARLCDLNLSELYHAMDEPLMTAVTEHCHSTLTRLAVGSSGVRFQRLAERCHQLDALDVNCCMWFDDEALESVCKSNPQLQSITMANCWRVTNDGLERIARMAHSQTAEDAATPPTAYAGTAVLQRLQTVNLYSCSVGDAGLRALGSISSLTCIDCGNCSTISDGGIQELAALPQLLRLSLENNIQITGSALPQLAAGTRGMRSLCLARCSMLEEDALLAALRSWLRIKWLDVSGCIKLTQKTQQYIERNLPECQLVHTISATAAAECSSGRDDGSASCLDVTESSLCLPPSSAHAPLHGKTGSDPIAQHWAKRRRTSTGPGTHASPDSSVSQTTKQRRSLRRSSAGSRPHSLRMTSLLRDTETVAPLTQQPANAQREGQLARPESAAPPAVFLSVPQLTSLMAPPPRSASQSAVTVSPSIIRRIELPQAQAKPMRTQATTAATEHKSAP